MLPPLIVDVTGPQGIENYIRAVSRDLRVAFALAGDARRRIHLLVQGAHEANFWLGEHLATAMQRAHPLQISGARHTDPGDAPPPGDDEAVADLRVSAPVLTSVQVVADRSGDATDDSHGVAAELAPEIISAPLAKRLRHRSGQDLPEIEALVQCLRSGTGGCSCSDSGHGDALIVAIDPQHRFDLAQQLPSRMGPPIDRFRTANTTDPITLWITTHDISTTDDGFAVFAKEVVTRITGVLGARPGIRRRYLAFTGPVPLAVLLGAALAHEGTWSYLAFQNHSYTPVSRPGPAPSAAWIKASAPAQPITLENYTPHVTLTWMGGDHRIDLPRLGEARCVEKKDPAGSYLHGEQVIPVVRITYGQAPSLPPVRPGVVLLVSQVVVRAHPERRDLAFPADLVRDGEGTIVGFRTLGFAGEKP